MRRHLSLLAAFAALIAALGIAPGFAHAGGDERSPAPTSRTGSASAWHAIAYDDALTTAKCVGDLRTPVCAVETVFACILRSGEICQKVIQPADSRAYFAARRSYPRDLIRYRVTREHRVPPVPNWAITDDRHDPRAPWRGDVVVIVESVDCTIEEPDCSWDRPWIKRFLTRNLGHGWRVVTWTTDRLD